MAEEWALGRGFGQTKAKDIETDGQMGGETAYHGTTLAQTPGSSNSRQGRKVGVRVSVNGYGGGVKSKRYPDGQAHSHAINRDTGHGEPIADGEEGDNTLDRISPPKGHSSQKSGYGKAKG